MKNGIQSIGVRTITALKVIAIAAVMSSAGPALNGTSVVSAQAKGIEEKAFWLGPLKICLGFCFSSGYCCEIEGQL